MRTISALIAATFCALAFSGSALAANRAPSHVKSETSGRLEMPTAFVAEDLWSGKVFATKAGRAQSPAQDREDTLWPDALENINNRVLQPGLEVLRGLGRVAERAPTIKPASPDLEGELTDV